MWQEQRNRPDPVYGDMLTVKDDTFTVSYRVFKDDKFGSILHLKIHRNDLKDGITWEELQSIKNDFAGSDTQAIEFYPREKHLVNIAPVRHLWCFMSGEQIKFGYRFRATSIEDLLSTPWEIE